jgi:C4-dicarboxylate transporter DctM subunit
MTATGEMSRVDGAGIADKKVVWLVRVVAIAAVAACVLVMFAGMARETVAVAALVLMLVLMLLDVPVAVALAVPGLLGLYALLGERAVHNALASLPYDSVASWSLSVLPMFVFMGLLLWTSGVTAGVYRAARHWLGWLPGGLAIGTNIAGTGLAAMSGSTAGTTYALARIGIPEMLAEGYHRRLAVGSVIVASLPGHLIPPSIMLVVYAGIAQVGVGPQLIAGVGPGVLIAASSCLMILVISTVRPAFAGGRHRGTAPAVSWSQRMRSLRSVWPLPVLVAVVLGSMFAGIFTATEAGAAGALGAVLLTFWYRRGANPLRAIGDAAVETVRAVGAIFLVLVGTFVLARLLAVSGLATGFANWIGDAGLGRVGFLVTATIAYLVLGTFMEGLPMMLLTVPLLIPTLAALDISLVWFGVFVVFMAELAVITPPVGILSFIVHGIVRDPEVNQGQDISLGDVFRSINQFLPAIAVFLVVIVAFPETVTYLPDLMTDEVGEP